MNTTEHALRYKQENSKSFVSGTVLSPDCDGSLPLSGGRSRAKYNDHDGDDVGRSRIKETIYSGMPGALAGASAGQCGCPPSEVARLIDKNLQLEQLAKISFMFNFHEGILSAGNQRLCVQLGDGSGATKYLSDWSRGFSLDSVGFSQVIRYVLH